MQHFWNFYVIFLDIAPRVVYSNRVGGEGIRSASCFGQGVFGNFWPWILLIRKIIQNLKMVENYMG